jgi:DNA invertase Pin-like site-specific DNA recombinase
VDTTTPAGEMMANVLAVLAQFERRLIGQRSREALAQKRAAGVVLGRPRQLPVDVVERIVAERAAGSSYAAIAAGLNAAGVPTVHGGVAWYPATVRGVVRAAEPAA